MNVPCQHHFCPATKGHHLGMRKTATKVPKPTPARMALASNLRHLMAAYQLGRGISSRGIASHTGLSYKTVDRMLDPYHDVSPNLASLDELAAFFRVESWQLIQPHHASTTANNHSQRSGIGVKS